MIKRRIMSKFNYRVSADIGRADDAYQQEQQQTLQAVRQRRPPILNSKANRAVKLYTIDR